MRVALRSLAERCAKSIRTTSIRGLSSAQGIIWYASWHWYIVMASTEGQTRCEAGSQSHESPRRWSGCANGAYTHIFLLLRTYGGIRFLQVHKEF